MQEQEALSDEEMEKAVEFNKQIHMKKALAYYEGSNRALPQEAKSNQDSQKMLNIISKSSDSQPSSSIYNSNKFSLASEFPAFHRVRILFN